MKAILFLPLILLSITGFTQKKYHCSFRDSTFYYDKDSSLPGSVENLHKRGLSAETTDDLINQLSSQRNYNTIQRKIFAAASSTIIRFDKSTWTGNLKIDNSPDSLLLKGGELYFASPEFTGFSKDPVPTSKKTFQPTGKIKLILNHACKEYLSTDSTCKIWVTEDLPSCINPGIRLQIINGAVLAFELKAPPFFTKSEILSIE